MIRTLVLGTLVAILPFSGMRVICIDATADTSSATEVSAGDADCERLCARHHVASTTTGATCALSTDPCALMVFACTVGVGPEEPSSALRLDVSAVPVDAQRFCLDPEVARRVPPPKLQVLPDIQLFSGGGSCCDQLPLARAAALV